MPFPVAQTVSATSADLTELEVGPVATSFPVDYTADATDGTGAVDHLVVSATETLSLATS